MTSADAFAAALPPDVRQALPEGWATTATDMVGQAMAAWPEVVGVDPNELARHLASRVDSVARFHELAAGRGASDLYLAFACVTNARGAARIFEKTFAPAVRASIAKLRLDAALAEDVAQQLFVRLLAPESGSSKLSEFDGRGRLEGFLRVLAARDGLDLVKKMKREVSLGEALADVPLAADDPETMFVKAAYRVEYRAAFAAAAAALDDGQRQLLRQHYLHRLGIDTLAELLGIHRATAARRIAQAREDLLAGARRELVTRLALPREEMEQMVQMIESNLEVSLRRLLGE